MLQSNKHKALAITILISGSVILSVFNMHLSHKKDIAVETFYDIKQEELTLEEEKLFEDKESIEAETNKAFNETKQYKKFAQAYKPIASPKDYEYKGEPLENTESNTIYKVSDRSTNSAKKLNREELDRFKNVSAVLDKQKQNEDAANNKSSMYFSLVNRTDVYLPTPIYLCESGGIVVVNITVNAEGNVTEANINGSSATSNECLQEHALEYALEALFSKDASKNSQIGTITFSFRGKR